MVIYMKKGMTIGTDVFIFYHPSDIPFSFSNLEVFVGGTIKGYKRLNDGNIYYEVIDKDGITYFGMHKRISSSNYFFMTEEEYIELLKEQLKYYDYKKEKYNRMILILESDIREKKNKVKKKKNGF